MNKYDPLYIYLTSQNTQILILSFDEIESIIGDKLPESAHNYTAWWANSVTDDHPHCRAWLDAGYRTIDVGNSIDKKIMTFGRI